MPRPRDRRGACARRRISWLAALLALSAGAAAGSPASARLRLVAVGGEPYAPLDRVATFYGMRLSAQGARATRLHSAWSTLDVTHESRRAALNGTTLWLHAPARGLRGAPRAAVSAADLDTVLDPLLRSADHLGRYRCRTILLDPGHGGRDHGATGIGGLREKDVALDLARRVRLRLVNRGYRVHLTRDADREVSLAGRVAEARRVRADLLVSLHLNAASAPSAHGVETFVLTAQGQPSTHESRPPRSANSAFPGLAHVAASTALGFEVQHALRRHTGAADRGLRRARYQLLRDAPCPAILVECGFVSNPSEASRLRTSAYLDRIADGIAEGIAAYDRRTRAAR